ncbi:MAG TPA: betaine-aldehyde dehydrogenase, partial [Microbacterium sp.]|nr:betaine-aldehyde dehydrogenase [Microbacterium sp.]
MTNTDEFTLRPRVQEFLASGRAELLIDGDWLPASAGATFTTIDPATGAALAEVARGTAPDVDKAVRAAKGALRSSAWREMRPADRGALLWRIADLMTEHLDDLAQLETLDQGKSLRTSRFGEVPAAINQFRYYAGWPTKILGDTIPTSLSRTPPGKEVFAYTRREPVGVVGAIVPWNSPLIM